MLQLIGINIQYVVGTDRYGHPIFGFVINGNIGQNFRRVNFIKGRSDVVKNNRSSKPCVGQHKSRFALLVIQAQYDFVLRLSSFYTPFIGPVEQNVGIDIVCRNVAGCLKPSKEVRSVKVGGKGIMKV